MYHNDIDICQMLLFLNTRVIFNVICEFDTKCLDTIHFLYKTGHIEYVLHKYGFIYVYIVICSHLTKFVVLRLSQVEPSKFTDCARSPLSLP